MRINVLVFSIASYGAFLLTFLYLLAFLANLQVTALADAFPAMGDWVPLSIDLGRDMGSLGTALVIDVALVALFGLQHSVMARPGFKRAWTRIVPKAAERSTYVLIASAVLAIVMWQWRPIPTPVLWHAETLGASVVGWGVMGLGVAVLLWHPQYLGWLLIFWGTPVMTAGHLLFAAGMSGYILIAVQFEERDLIRHIGADYVRYRQEVPAVVPVPGKRYGG